jgi:hypothetical protein
MEMYGVIENLQRTIQQLELERLSPRRQSQTFPLPSRSQTSLSVGSETVVADSFSGDRPCFTFDQEIFEIALNKMRTSLQQLMQEPQCSIQQVQSELQSMLIILEQLSQLSYS